MSIKLTAFRGDFDSYELAKACNATYPSISDVSLSALHELFEMYWVYRNGSGDPNNLQVGVVYREQFFDINDLVALGITSEPALDELWEGRHG